jgi:hypothetical protein
MAGLFGGSTPTASAYKPTVRDKIARALVGDSGPYSLRSKLAEGMLGSTGLGSTGNLNVADMTGLGMFLGADEAGRQIGSGHPLRGAATLAMALPLPLAKGAKAAKGLFGGAERAAERVVEAAPKPKPPIVAYHGSPHQFDAFSMDKLGTGEGAQAFGHGLYFAENEGVAKEYRDKLSRQVSLNGRPVASTHPSDGPAGAAQHAVAARVANGESPADAIAAESRAWREEAQRYRDAAKSDPSLAKEALDQAGQFDGIAAATEAYSPSAFQKNPGHMYEVGIHAQPEHFLDWDKPLKEQHPKVQDVLAQKGITNPDHTGGQIYESSKLVPGDYHDPKAAAKALHEAGIPGIRYLDQGSRGTGTGTRNYVVFNDKMVDILKRYGIAAPAMLGAGAAYSANQQGK